MRVLVTGGAGFIGSHLVDALVARGDVGGPLDDLSTGRRENLAHLAADPRHRLVVGDIRDPDTCLHACRGVELVFHEAALGSVPRSMEDPATTIAINVLGTANLLNAARKASVGRVVYASSSSVYGDSDVLFKREGEEGRPLSPYAASKRMSEELAEAFGRCYGLACVGLRYFNVYGPRQRPDGPYAAVIPAFLKRLHAGQAPVIYGDGSQTRDFTYVADVVAANLAAAQAPRDACGTVYNIAGGHGVSVTELALRLVLALGRTVAPVYAAARQGDVRHSVADVARARERLGHVPVHDLERGLSRLLEGPPAPGPRPAPGATPSRPDPHRARREAR